MTIDLIRCVGTFGAAYKNPTRPGVYGYVDGVKVSWKPTQGWRCRDCGASCKHIDALAGTIANTVTRPVSDFTNAGTHG